MKIIESIKRLLNLSKISEDGILYIPEKGCYLGRVNLYRDKITFEVPNIFKSKKFEYEYIYYQFEKSDIPSEIFEKIKPYLDKHNENILKKIKEYENKLEIELEKTEPDEITVRKYKSIIGYLKNILTPPKHMVMLTGLTGRIYLIPLNTTERVIDKLLELVSNKLSTIK